MAISFLQTLHKGNRPKHIGGKAEQLQSLIARHMQVPLTHVLIWDLYATYQQDSAAALTAVRQEITERVDLTKTYAVRSSANLEDSANFSFAGQFSSILQVQGLDNLLAATQEVWDSARNPALQSYLTGSGRTVDEIKMAVILQEMVEPVVSGVAFSKNPMTGLDEIIVEAVCGLGEGLMQDGVTPDRWVYKWGAWIQQPAQTEIATAVIADVVAGTKAIAAEYERPLDLEWVYSGTTIYWVQQREITTLNGINIYSNRISREVLPGIIKPLVWSINVPLVNSAWIDIFTELIGPNNIAPEDLTKAFYYRAYFNMGVIGRVFAALGMPGETLEIMMGLKGGEDTPRFRPSNKVVKHVPRMLKFVWAKWRFGREIDRFLPEMDRTYAAFAGQSLADMSLADLLSALESLIHFTRKSAYMNIVGPLLMLLYNGLFKRGLARYDIPYERFDLVHNLPDIAQYDPNNQLPALHDQFRQLDLRQQAAIRAGEYADFQASNSVPQAFKTAVAQFIRHFGHLSESGNDFSRVPWREDPDFVLRMIITRAAAGAEVHAEKNAPPAAPQVLMNWESAPLSPFGRWRLRGLFRRARQFRLYREAISFKYTFGYGLIRNYTLALADHFVQSGFLATREEIFYLYLDEIQAIGRGDTTLDVKGMIATRKEEIAAVAAVTLPEIIYGDDTPPPEKNDIDQDRLAGIPTSGGYFKGAVCVIKNMDEFDKMHPNAVLVIPYSDVSWTPLFSRAGAVIAESGGMLSHSSIVAREYHLPAVVSVTGACDLLQDGMLVTVDGYEGEVLVEK